MGKKTVIDKKKVKEFFRPVANLAAVEVVAEGSKKSVKELEEEYAESLVSSLENLQDRLTSAFSEIAQSPRLTKSLPISEEVLYLLQDEERLRKEMENKEFLQDILGWSNEALEDLYAFGVEFFERENYEMRLQQTFSCYLPRLIQQSQPFGRPEPWRNSEEKIGTMRCSAMLLLQK